MQYEIDVGGAGELVHLWSRGVEYWSVGVLAADADAERLYRRQGFQPWNQSLLQSTRPGA